MHPRENTNDPQLVVTFGQPAPPLAPSGLSATAVSSSRIDLAWTENATNEDGFRIERSPGGQNNWSQIATVGTDVTSFSDTGLPAGTSYDYRVRAYAASGNSGYSNKASATTSTCAAPGTQTLTSVADSLVAEAAPTINYGTDATNFGVRSYSGGDARSLLRFNLPSIPSGCSVTGATLRLYTTSGAAGRTLEVGLVSSSWTETTVTWNNQPATSGSAATTASGTGWRELDVAAHVQTMYGGSNNGWLLRDASENSGTIMDQVIHPRENTNAPQLVITFG